MMSRESVQRRARQAQAVARDLKAEAVEELSAATDGSGVVLWHSSSFRPGPGLLDDEDI